MASVAFGYMLETPSIPHYHPEGINWKAGDNVLGADNQQERLIQLGWVIGFVDGEGCFSISFVRQPSRTTRQGYKTGYQVTHEFVVTQGAKSIDCLHAIQKFFGVGQVLVNKRYDNHKEHLYRYVVRKRSELLDVVIPFFRNYPLRTAKSQDFAKFARCVELVQTQSHLSPAGLLSLVEIAQTMNSRKLRPGLISILRDHTPNPETSGEDMVPAAWRHAGGSLQANPARPKEVE